MSVKREIKKQLKFYLAGPITWVETEDYALWREEISKLLIKCGHIPINPLNKYKVPGNEKTKVEKMIIEEKDEIAREFIRRKVINPDIQLMEQSDACIAYVPYYSVGTSSEMFYFYYHGKPVYVITSLPRKQWSGWFVGLSTLIFTTWKDFERFIRRMEI